MRLLLEYATGVYSGSIYDDFSLTDVLPGESCCDDRVGLLGMA